MSTIRSLSVGNGDMFYIKHGSDNFTMIDCCMDDGAEKRLVELLQFESKGVGITRFISTHPDDDHIRGLAYLHKKMDLLNFYCITNQATKPDDTDDFDQYCALRDDQKKAFYLYKGCQRKWMNLNDTERGSSGLNVLWPITSNSDYQDALREAANGECPNNISIILKYALNNGVTALWMGDLESNFMDKIVDEITLPSVDILFAPHHGRTTGSVPTKWLEQMSPQIIVIGEAPAEHLNYYQGYNAITQNSAWDITFECRTGKVDVFVSNDEYSVDFLEDENLLSNDYGTYIGTLSTRS
jgi:beta-lactamase superfamily II metal-dependent hydrolase